MRTAMVARCARLAASTWVRKALRSRTLGMQLLTTLTKQLEGQLTITSDPGATFSLSFRIM